jgi:hypothetical protein
MFPIVICKNSLAIRITLHEGKVFPDAGYGVVADSAVRKGRAFVRICLVLVGGLFGTEAVLYTSNELRAR